ncbi:hypothetical protein F4808DRAFT_70128 [Astrocystis sublimbata]|nr:hypothetical protein F4808DRAFT_70128 [Astrocystis sublimbata]
MPATRFLSSSFLIPPVRTPARPLAARFFISSINTWRPSPQPLLTRRRYASVLPDVRWKGLLLPLPENSGEKLQGRRRCRLGGGALCDPLCVLGVDDPHDVGRRRRPDGDSGLGAPVLARGSWRGRRRRVAPPPHLHLLFGVSPSTRRTLLGLAP